MRLKSNRVDVRGVHPAIFQDLFRIDEWWRRNFGYEVIFTSVCDGHHSMRSQHYRGLAVDCRTWTTANSGKQLKENRDKKFKALKRFLGANWYCLDEKTHFHLDFRPTRENL